MSFAERRRAWKRNEQKVPLIICCVFFTVFAISLLYPLVWILVKSFVNPVNFVFERDRFFPETIYFKNYAEMFKQFNFGPMILNTLFLSLVCPTVQIFSCACISYAYAKFDFRFKKLVFFICISGMFIPSVGTLAALYELMSNLHLMDTFLGYILWCGNGMGFSFLLVSSQFVNVSKEYAEAAEIDGASQFRIFIQIMLPQITPTLITLWILSFISCWNDYMGPYLFLPSHPTLSIGIKNLSTTAEQSGGTDYPILFSGIIMVEIPVLIIFFAFQKKILSFSIGGGLKG